MFTITSMVIVTLIKNVGKPTFIFTDFLHFILPFTRAFSYPFQKDEQDLYIEKIVRKVLQEELQQMARGHGLFGESFCRGLESQGVERNCPTCIFNASKHYGRCD